MEIRTSTVAVVAASCITIGAAGAFLASRPSGDAVPQAVPAADVATNGGVEQSEGVVADAPVSQPRQPPRHRLRLLWQSRHLQRNLDRDSSACTHAGKERACSGAKHASERRGAAGDRRLSSHRNAADVDRHEGDSTQTGPTSHC